jgi:RimJ/RimL family protein N-acetyltransferase
MEQPRPEIVPGDRIYLTHLRREDVPLMAAWFADLELNAYLGRVGGSITLEQEQQWFDSLAGDASNVTFGIVVPESGRLIGSVSLMHINHQHGRAELGIALGDKVAWNQGYGTEAVRLMAEYGCFFLSLHAIMLSFVEFNERGQQAYLRAGFKLAGRWRQAYRIGDERYDSVWMDITRDDLDLSRMRRLVGLLPRRDDR